MSQNQQPLFGRPAPRHEEAANAASLAAGAAWKSLALDVLRAYLDRIGNLDFTAERLVAFAHGRGFESPPDA